jgi:hypothetical protein
MLFHWPGPTPEICFAIVVSQWAGVTPGHLSMLCELGRRSRALGYDGWEVLGLLTLNTDDPDFDALRSVILFSLGRFASAVNLAVPFAEVRHEKGNPSLSRVEFTGHKPPLIQHHIEPNYEGKKKCRSQVV